MTCGKQGELLSLGGDRLEGVGSCWDLAEQMCQFRSANWSLERGKPQSLVLCWGRPWLTPCLKRAASPYAKPPKYCCFYFSK